VTGGYDLLVQGQSARSDVVLWYEKSTSQVHTSFSLSTALSKRATGQRGERREGHRATQGEKCYHKRPASPLGIFFVIFGSDRR
jgi:hypothetical protein